MLRTGFSMKLGLYEDMSIGTFSNVSSVLGSGAVPRTDSNVMGSSAWLRPNGMAYILFSVPSMP